MDWRTTRSAIEAAYSGMGEIHPGNIPERDWKLVDLALKAFMSQTEAQCVECRKPIEFRAEIVCLDCNAPLHRSCASKHFWPNGRTPSPREADQ